MTNNDELETEPHIKIQQVQDNQMSAWLEKKDYEKISLFLTENPHYTFGFDYHRESRESNIYRNASFALGRNFPKEPGLSLLVLKHTPDFSQTLKGLMYIRGPKTAQHLKFFLDNTQKININIMDEAGYYQWALNNKKVNEEEYKQIIHFFKQRGTKNDCFYLSLMTEDYESAHHLSYNAEIDPHLKNKFGSPFLHEAAYRWPENNDNILKWKNLCQIFKNNPSFDPNIMNEGQYAGTVIHSLIFRKKLQFALDYVKTFNGQGLNLNLKNFKGWAPVHGLLRDSKDIMHVFLVSENTLNPEETTLKRTICELFSMMAKNGMDLNLKSGKKNSGKTAKKIAAEKDGGPALLAIATENLLREIAIKVSEEANVNIQKNDKPRRKI